MAYVSHLALVLSMVLLGVASFVLMVIFFAAFRRYRTKRKVYEMQFEQLMKSPDKSFSADEPANDQINALPYDATFDLARSDIMIEQALGEGNFGIIYSGKMLNNNGEYPVAIKCPKTDSCQDKQVLMDELKVLIYVGNHPNVLGVIGSVRENFLVQGEFLVVVQLCELGDVHSFLRQFNSRYNSSANKNSDSLARIDLEKCPNETGKQFVNEIAKLESNGYVQAIDASSADIDTLMASWRSLATIYKAEVIPSWENEVHVNRTSAALFTSDLLSFALQTANGMMYLADKQIIHRDLAARNLLLTENRVIKISDFGLSRRRAQHSHYYAMQNALQVKLPLKWTAVECLQPPFKFSTKSDVWSFGVTLWEMFSLCESPYANPDSVADDSFATAADFYDYLKSGKRLPWTNFAPPEIYTLMDECWQTSPSDRPDFAKCIDFLSKQLTRCSRQLSNTSPNALRKFSECSSKKSSLADTIVYHANSPIIAPKFSSCGQDGAVSRQHMAKRCFRKLGTRLCARDSNWLCAFLSLFSALLLVFLMATVIIIHNTVSIDDGTFLGTHDCQMCADGSKCVDDAFVCDGRRDCMDGSDEFNCTASTCKGFMCTDGSKCLTVDEHCNGLRGCSVDGSDESNCTEEQCQGFLCKNGERCINAEKRCNGLRGCPGDGSDERNCTIVADNTPYWTRLRRHFTSSFHVESMLSSNSGFTTESGADGAIYPSKEEQCKGFLCYDGSICTTFRRRCNGDPLCPDESDELDCTECTNDGFLCTMGRCIQPQKRCDGRLDCEDGSDEIDCVISNVTVVTNTPSIRQLLHL